jgi:hypothetical protein
VPMGESYYDRRGGELHMAWPALFPLVVYPFHRAFGWFGIFVLPIACGALSVWMTGVIADRIRPGTGWMAALLVAVATPVLVYSTLYWEHTIALALELGALLLVMNFATKPRRWALVAAGAMAGLGAAGFRGDVALFAASAFGAVFLLTRGRERWFVPPLVSLGFAIGCAPGALLNLVLNGHVSPPNAVNNTPPPSLAYLRSVHFVGIVPHILVGKTVPEAMAWQTTIAAAVLALAFYATRRRHGRVLLVVLLGAAVVLGVTSLRELDASGAAFHGCLAICPVLALGLLQSDAPLTVESRSAKRVVILTVAFLLSLVAMAIGVAYPEGWASDHNLEWGPRYWLAVFPLMAVLVAVNHDAFIGAFRAEPKAVVWRWLAGGVAVGLLLVSADLVWIGMARIRRLLVDQDGIRKVLREHRDDVLLSDTFGVSALVPEDFARRPSFYVNYDFPLGFDGWLTRAVDAGLTSFDLVTFGGPDHPFLKRDVAACECSLHVEEITRWRFLSLIRVRIASGPGRTSRTYFSDGERHKLYGGIFEKYVTLGETTSYLGLPTTDEAPTTTGCDGGRAVGFEHGTIEWCPDRGALDHKTTTGGAPL